MELEFAAGEEAGTSTKPSSRLPPGFSVVLLVWLPWPLESVARSLPILIVLEGAECGGLAAIVSCCPCTCACACACPCPSLPPEETGGVVPLCCIPLALLMLLSEEGGELSGRPEGSLSGELDGEPDNEKKDGRTFENVEKKPDPERLFIRDETLPTCSPTCTSFA